MNDIHSNSLRLAEEWLENTSDKEFIDDYNSIVKDNGNKEELTDFDIFQALDRTSVLINMVSETLGYVGFQDEEGFLDDVLPAVKKHYVLLDNIQNSLMDLYQQLGRDLAMKGEDK